MTALLQLKSAELVFLHRCAYGAPSQKTICILAIAPWMKMVREVTDHIHVPRAGRAWDYLEETWVWKTSLAGVCLWALFGMGVGSS